MISLFLILLTAIEMDNIDASEIQDIQSVNKAAKHLEVFIISIYDVI